MESSSSVAVSTDSTEAPRTTSAEPAPKKKRNLTGMPDPEAEVIALSPNSLMATNRFVCEICSKGFQRDQNLQLHRRGHNLPWKLKQKAASDQVRKRVYVCPESTCVHHSPSRALGDLTGIKKHFCRKHGEKKWKCERCSKKYAVQSDWKAHMKVCGTKEYKCICGTVFSRRDSFITHRAFCDALTEESSKVQEERTVAAPLLPPSPPPHSPATATVSPVLSVGSDLPENAPEPEPLPPPPPPPAICAVPAPTPFEATTSGGAPPPQPATPSISNIVSPLPEFSVADQVADESLPSPSSTEPSASLSLFLSTTASSIFSRQDQSNRLYASAAQPQPPAMSATALLQKAAQMGATSSNGSLLQGLGLAISSTYDTTTTNISNPSSQWGEPDRFDQLGYGLGLGLASEERMVPESSMFGAQPMTLDFLGLGGPRAGLSALLTTLEGGLGSGSTAPCSSGSRGSKGGTWEGGGAI